MNHLLHHKILIFIALVTSLFLCLSPVLADNASVSIAYRGAGGNYIGDAITFDGYDSASNITLLKLTGPGLPEAGVPMYDLNGQAGGGNPVEVNSDGTWRFVWYTGSILNLDQMQTARYYITAFDKADPSKSATTSVMMKKPDFFIVPTPNPVEKGDYLQLLGTAERGTADIRIEVMDVNGQLLHVYETSASDSGYFNYGFHVDMQPGDYPVTITSSTMKATYRTVIHVAEPNTTVVSPTPVNTVAGLTTSTSAPIVTVASPVTIATPVSPGNAEPVPVSPLAIIAGLIIAGLVVLLILVIGRKI